MTPAGSETPYQLQESFGPDQLCGNHGHYIFPRVHRDAFPARPNHLTRVARAGAESGQEYTARLATQLGFLNFRLPFNAFRYTSGGEGPAPLDPARLTNLAIRRAACV